MMDDLNIKREHVLQSEADVVTKITDTIKAERDDLQRYRDELERYKELDKHLENAIRMGRPIPHTRTPRSL